MVGIGVEFVYLHQHAPRAGEEGGAFGRQGQSIAAPIKQSKADLLFDVGNRRMQGRMCSLVGFLGGGEPLTLQPVFQIPSGRRLSVFASALATGGPEFPLSEIPFQSFLDKAASGVYRAKPAHVFGFDEIRKAHRLVESGDANGKIVVDVG